MLHRILPAENFFSGGTHVLRCSGSKISAVLCPDVRQKINPVKMLLFSVTAYVILVCPRQCLIRHIKIYPFDIAVRRCFHG